jgi:hypothetical protein
MSSFNPFLPVFVSCLRFSVIDASHNPAKFDVLSPMFPLYHERDIRWFCPFAPGARYSEVFMAAENISLVSPCEIIGTLGAFHCSFTGSIVPSSG